jgi:3-hexulose-6-phosphate synthase
MKLHISLAKNVEDFCDAFEIGPVLLMQYGINAIKEFRTAFPQKTIICDSNITEFEKEMVALASQAGADWVTALAGAGTNTIHNTCSSAHSAGKKVMIDFIDAASAGQIAADAKSFGADALVVHNHPDANPYALLDRWDMVKGNTTLPVFISTNVTRANLNDLIKLDPAGIIVGHAVTLAENPREEAEYFYNIIKNK